jgi:hypothetical protein
LGDFRNRWGISHTERTDQQVKPLFTILIMLACLLRYAAPQTRRGGIEMNTLKAVDGSDRGHAAANEGGGVSNAIVVSEWDADAFHRRVSDLERRGYVVRRETYRVTPETNPETGRIVHLHTVELYWDSSDEAESRDSSEPADRQ